MIKIFLKGVNEGVNIPLGVQVRPGDKLMLLKTGLRRTGTDVMIF
jgi:hypothetical protein